MTKKQYTTLVLLILGLLLLAFGNLTLGAVFQDTASSIVPYGWFIGLFFVFLIATFVLLFVNFKKLMKYEIERKLAKFENLEVRKLKSIRMKFGESSFETLFGKFKHGRTSMGLYWIFRPSTFWQPISFILEYEYNVDMTVKDDEKVEIDIVESSSDVSDPKIGQVMVQLPKASNQGFHARVFINMHDYVDDAKIVQAERIVTNFEIVSRSLGIFSPILLYFLYDKSTGTLYYEPYKPYRMYQRPRALKMFLKMLGVDIR